MNTKFRTCTVLAAAFGALLLVSSVQAGDGGAIGEAIREARAGRDKGEGNAAPPQQSAPRQSAPRQSAPRVDRDASRGDRTERSARGNGSNAGEGRSPPRFSRSLPAPAGTVVQGRSDRGPIGSVIERGVNRDDRDNGRDYRRNRPPRYVSSLPGGYRQYHWNGRPYYNHGGHWYRPYGGRYLTVGAPYGLFVNYLPGFYSTFWFGNTRYYHADDTYYLYEPARRGYVVTRSPYADDRDEEYSTAEDEDLFVYPAQGQSEQQQADDRYECHRWAAGQTNYDPVDSTYDADQRADYLRAMTACLTGRGYSVK